MIDEHNVREMLQRRANAAPTPTVDAPKATRRARRRLFANGVIASMTRLDTTRGPRVLATSQSNGSNPQSCSTTVAPARKIRPRVIQTRIGW